MSTKAKPNKLEKHQTLPVDAIGMYDHQLDEAAVRFFGHMLFPYARLSVEAVVKEQSGGTPVAILDHNGRIKRFLQ